MLKLLFSLLGLLAIVSVGCSQSADISAEDEWTSVGINIDGEIAGGKFGYSTSLSADGDRVAIGSTGGGQEPQ